MATTRPAERETSGAPSSVEATEAGPAPDLTPATLEVPREDQLTATRIVAGNSGDYAFGGSSASTPALPRSTRSNPEMAFAGPAGPGGAVAAGPPRVGTVLGKYLLTDQLGQGSAGLVYRALHQTLNIPVAVKVLRPTTAERGPRIYQQLKAEARLLAQLNHPNVVRVWDFEDDPRFPYLVLEYVEGLNLLELIGQSGRVRLDRAVSVIRAVAQALSAAHRVGIIHRDVKPGNILMTRDGTPKIADLGQAVVIGEWIRTQGQNLPQERVAGTAAYIAPEQFLAPETIDHRCDIYALGATFYHALTGQFPFWGRSCREVMFRSAHEQPTPPHEVVPELPASVSDVVLTMMAKDPDDRYHTYDELIGALMELESNLPLWGATSQAMSATQNSTLTGTANGSRVVRTLRPSSFEVSPEDMQPRPASQPRTPLKSTGVIRLPPQQPPPQPASDDQLHPATPQVPAIPVRSVAQMPAPELPRADVTPPPRESVRPESSGEFQMPANLGVSSEDEVTGATRPLAVRPHGVRPRPGPAPTAPDELPRGGVRQLLQDGIAAAKRRDKATARGLLQQVVRVEPKNEQAVLWLAGAMESPLEALPLLQRVLQLNPNNQRALLGMKEVRLQIGIGAAKAEDHETARLHLRAAIDQDPGLETAWLWMARVAESPQEALRCLHVVLKINPNNERAIQAIKWYETQLQPRSLWKCPLCTAEAEHRIEACPRCGAVLSLRDVDAALTNRNGNRELLQKAVATFEDAARQESTFEAHFHLGLALLNLRDASRALPHFQKALRLKPDDTELRGQVAALLRCVAAARQVPTKGSVLVVDDSPTVRKVVSKTLSEQGFHIIEAPDGYEALNRVREGLPGLVLLDITMPGMDGYQVAKILRGDPRTVAVPIIMLSGKDGLFDKLRGKLAGCKQYMTKPFKPEKLVQVVTKYCRTSANPNPTPVDDDETDE